MRFVEKRMMIVTRYYSWRSAVLPVRGRQTAEKSEAMGRGIADPLLDQREASRGFSQRRVDPAL